MSIPRSNFSQVFVGFTTVTITFLFQSDCFLLQAKVRSWFSKLTGADPNVAMPHVHSSRMNSSLFLTTSYQTPSKYAVLKGVNPSNGVREDFLRPKPSSISTPKN